MIYYVDASFVTGHGSVNGMESTTHPGKAANGAKKVEHRLGSSWMVYAALTPG